MEENAKNFNEYFRQIDKDNYNTNPDWILLYLLMNLGNMNKQFSRKELLNQVTNSDLSDSDKKQILDIILK